MRITCGVCKAVYSIDDSLLTATGVKAQCPACGDIQVLRSGEAAAVPPPLPAAPPQVPAAPPQVPAAPPQVQAAPPQAPAAADPFAGLQSTAPSGAADDPFAEVSTAPIQAPVSPSMPADDPFAALTGSASATATPAQPSADPFSGPPAAPAPPPAQADPFADLSTAPAAAPVPPVSDDPFASITQPRPGDEDPFASLTGNSSHPASSTDAFGAATGGDAFSAFSREEQAGVPSLGAPDPTAPGEDADLMSRRVSSRPQPTIKEQVPSKRCARCGRGLEDDSGGGGDGLCSSCFAMLGPKEVSYDDDREWRVQKPDGIILGPLTSNEVKDKFKSKEVGASDKLARRDGDFRLISSYPEFAIFFRRPGESLQPTFRTAPQGHGLRNSIIALLVLLLGGAAAFYFFFWDVQPEDLGNSAIEETLDSFAAEIPNPTGSAHEWVKKARKMMLRDERIGYMEADRLFKTAILLEPSNMSAIGGWVQNRALLDTGSSDVGRRKMALDLIDFALERAPDLPDLQRSRAFLLESLGRHQDAQLVAGKVYTSLPDDPETQLVLGMTYLDSHTEKALELFTKAMEGNPNLNMAYRMLGEANIRLGRFHDALAFFQRRLERDPGQFQSLKAVATVYTAVGEFGKAAQVYETILGTEPDKIEAAIAAARIKSQFYNKAREAHRLLAAFEKANEDLPPAQMAQVMCERAACLRLAGKQKKALEVVTQALEKDPMQVIALYLRAVLEVETGDVAKAIGHLREMRSHLPEEPRVLAWLAIAEGQVPNQESALRNMRRAVELGVNDLDLFLQLGVIHLDLDNVNRAYTWLRKATEISPFYSRDHRTLKAFFDGDDFMADSILRAMRALESRSDDAMALTLAGAVLWRGGKTGEAKQRLEQAVAMDPENVASNLYLGAIMMERRQWGAAEKFLKKAHAGDALQPVAARLLAETWTRLGRAKKAERLLGNVIKADPGDLSARLLLAEIYLNKKKTKKKGMELLQKVYEGDNSNLRAKRLLFKLKT